MDVTKQSYPDTMTWLNSRQQLGIELGLDRIETLMKALGRPDSGTRFVHVAGTNGKGSVATLLSEALRRSGHRTGLYTSPHLVEFSERIRVDGTPITREQIVRVVESMRPVIDEMDQADTPPTFFEICTAAAFVHFRTEGVAWAVVETGMGGRTDATNVIHPDLTIITNVELDHTAFLGDDVATIAREKAGILEEGVPLVTGALGAVLELIKEEAAHLSAPVTALHDDYLLETSSGRLVMSQPSEKVTSYEILAAGAHQAENAAHVVAACNVLLSQGVELSPQTIVAALAETPLPGRLERLSHDDIDVIIDSAHNVAAIEVIAAELEPEGDLFDLIVGFNEDKDWQTMLRRLIPLARMVWAVPVRSPRSLDPASTRSAIPPHVRLGTASGFEEALELAAAEGADRILVTGSIFLAGEARAVLTGQELAEVGGRQ